jgi:hypothetical protein
MPTLSSQKTRIASASCAWLRTGQVSAAVVFGIIILAPTVTSMIGGYSFLHSRQDLFHAAIQTRETWERHAVGNLTVEVPTSWKGAASLSEGEASWCLGETQEPIAIFNVLRQESYDELISDMDVSETNHIELAGRSAIRYVGRAHGTPSGRRILVVLDQSQTDGRRIGFVCFARVDAWPKLAPIFDQMLNSVRFRS